MVDRPGLCLASTSWPAYDFVAQWGRPEPWRALSVWQRRRLLCLAASSAHAASLDAALAHCGVVATDDVLLAAAAGGNVEIVERLFSEGCSWSEVVTIAAAALGHLPVLKLLRQRGMLGLARTVPVSLRKVVMQAACRGGQLQVASWLEDELGWLELGDEGSAADAAEGGHVGLLKKLVARLPDRALRCRLFSHVACGCSLAVSQWFYRNCIGSAAATHMDVVLKVQAMASALGSRTSCWRSKIDWMLQSLWGPEPWRALERSATHDLWALASKQPDYLARLQHLAACGLAPQPNIPCPAVNAAQERHADALAWLIDSCHVEAGEDVVDAAAVGGCVGVLGVLRARGTAFKARHVAAAAGSINRLDAVRWLAEAAEGGTTSEWSETFRNVAVFGADQATLCYLHEQRGAAVDLKAVIVGGSEEAVEWAVRHYQQKRSGGIPAFSAEQFWGLGAACGNIAGVESLLRLGGLQLPLTPPHVRLTPHEMYDALMQPAILELWADDNVSCFGILRWWLQRLPAGKELTAAMWARVIDLARMAEHFPPHQMAWFKQRHLEAALAQLIKAERALPAPSKPSGHAGGSSGRDGGSAAAVVAVPMGLTAQQWNCLVPSPRLTPSEAAVVAARADVRSAEEALQCWDKWSYCGWNMVEEDQEESDEE
ncbi:hypothetical protein CHLRE_06g283450v5 [Chlamydomonas reinhardtii]|uniref:Uncharacterized protein n=1 Tax=Chlamydomonas reinhardtii TaxID=3055 RepID=A0A2K3DPY5_CHLRE|nr:uncharacterized protein CHLRE_06g283450v5 [Chlamydomonas reinhardtii]PNW82548.1 hypothetical protein CHLRE_06g283450v5 [Chlamydomonas reinhardtii]